LNLPFGETWRLKPARRTDGDVCHLLQADALDDIRGAVVVCAAQTLHQPRPRIQAAAFLRHGDDRETG
jgi:hypothetical protein